MRTLGSAPDPFLWQIRSPSPNVGEPVNLDIYEQVYSGLVQGENTAVILIYGQSLPSNYVNSSYTVLQAKNHMFNPINGGVYKTKEPVVGCNGGRYGYSGVITGNATARIGDLLIAAGLYDRVIICNICAGGTSSTQWATGDCKQRLEKAGARLIACGLPPTFVIRDQSTTDTAAGTPAATMTANIGLEVATLRGVGVTAPIFLNLSAWNGAASVGTPAYNAVRTGITNAVDEENEVYLGFDTDTIGSGGRFDDIHFNSTGASTWATGIKDMIAAFIA